MAGTLVANTINTDTGLFSTNNAYSGIAKAWVNFTGSTGGATINQSFNVSSVTRNSRGNYTINFTTALSSTGYAGLISCSCTSDNNPPLLGEYYAGTRTTSAYQVYFLTYNAVNSIDPAYASVAILI